MQNNLCSILYIPPKLFAGIRGSGQTARPH